MDLSPKATADAIVESGNGVLLDAFMKCQSVLRTHARACVSISGGGTPMPCSTWWSALSPELTAR